MKIKDYYKMNYNKFITKKLNNNYLHVDDDNVRWIKLTAAHVKSIEWVIHFLFRLADHGTTTWEYDDGHGEEYWNDPTLNCTWENLNMNDLDLVKTRPIRFRLSDITACDLYSVAHIKYHELKTVSNMHASYIIQNADKVNCTIPGFKSFAHAMPFIKNELELDDSEPISD